MSARKKKKPETVVPPGPGERVQRMHNLLRRALEAQGQGVVLTIDPPKHPLQDWLITLTRSHRERSIEYRHGSGFRLKWFKPDEMNGAFTTNETWVVHQAVLAFEDQEQIDTLIKLSSGERVDRMRRLLAKALQLRNWMIEIISAPPVGVRTDWLISLTLGQHKRHIFYDPASGFRVDWEPSSPSTLNEAWIVEKAVQEFESLKAAPAIEKPEEETTNLCGIPTDELEAELNRRNAGYAMKQLPQYVKRLEGLINTWNAQGEVPADVEHTKKQVQALVVTIREVVVTIRHQAKLVFDTVNANGELPPLTKTKKQLRSYPL
jgi:hypothetical protein